MRELDAVLAGFLDSSFAMLDAADRERMAVILDLPDPELHAYLVGRAVPEDPAFADLFRRIREDFVPPG
jgi:succinate dehydrogenase flavin-adding protein (antitoxin of CptAB toxin-antitoxin module)